jgi:ribosomal protein S7
MLSLPKKEKKKLFIKVKPDIFSNTQWLVKFGHSFMQRGRDSSIVKIIHRVFKKIKKKYHKDASKIIFLALIKNRPILGFAPIRLGREVKKIPVPLSPRRQLVISLKWFSIAMKLLCYQAKDTSMEKILYTELKRILLKEKSLLTKRRINHMKELIENRVNLHHRWK